MIAESVSPGNVEQISYIIRWQWSMMAMKPWGVIYDLPCLVVNDGKDGECICSFQTHKIGTILISVYISITNLKYLLAITWLTQTKRYEENI